MKVPSNLFILIEAIHCTQLYKTSLICGIEISLGQNPSSQSEMLSITWSVIISYMTMCVFHENVISSQICSSYSTTVYLQHIKYTNTFLNCDVRIRWHQVGWGSLVGIKFTLFLIPITTVISLLQWRRNAEVEDLQPRRFYFTCRLAQPLPTVEAAHLVCTDLGCVFW